MTPDVDLEDLRFGTDLIKRGFARMQKGGVVMDVTDATLAATSAAPVERWRGRGRDRDRGVPCLGVGRVGIVGTWTPRAGRAHLVPGRPVTDAHGDVKYFGGRGRD